MILWQSMVFEDVRLDIAEEHWYNAVEDSVGIDADADADD